MLIYTLSDHTKNQLTSYYNTINTRDNNSRQYIQKNMDSHFQKRMKFRQSIRNRQIQQFKKSKRQLFQQYNQRVQNQQKQQKLYHNILSNSQQLFNFNFNLNQQQNYLQMLRQALNWNKIINYKHLLPDILLNLVKFYDENININALTDNVVMLLVECIAMIFFQTVIQFQQLSKKCLLICWEQFQKNKLGEDISAMITNRCLIAIQNITFSQNHSVLQLCEQLSILQTLQQLIQSFPTQNNIKTNILSIYQNLILHHIKQTLQKQQPIYYYSVLLKQCITQNYNPQILNKAVQVFCCVINYQQIDRVQFVEEMDYLYFCVLNAGYYVQDSQVMLAKVLELFVDGDYNIDVYPTLIKMYDIAQMLTIKYAQYIKNTPISKSYFYLSILSTKHFQQTQQQKLQQLTKQFCNFWINLQDDCSQQFQFYFLKFLRHSLSKNSVASTLYNQYEMGVNQNNSICAPTWEIVLEFISGVRIQGVEKMELFLRVLEIQVVNQMVVQPYRTKIVEKVQGCYYNQNSQQLSRLSEIILKNYS